MQFDVISDISQDNFIQNYIAENLPVIVRGIPFKRENWNPKALDPLIGELNAQIYGSLFDLEDVNCAADYIDEYFGQAGPYQDDVPYIRWYNQLKDIEFAWGDEAFAALSDLWQKPNCMPDKGLVVPLAQQGGLCNPVTDAFPYRGVLIAARGARTRLHRDPFCTDAVVAQYHGVKEAALYHPDRTSELLADTDSSSFGGFVDVREESLDTLSHEPDYHGEIHPGDLIYIPHGWLHDVIVVEDSISVTWNFIHQQGAKEFEHYLRGQPETDSEFEVLQYFYARAGLPNATPQEILARIAAPEVAVPA